MEDRFKPMLVTMSFISMILWLKIGNPFIQKTILPLKLILIVQLLFKISCTFTEGTSQIKPSIFEISLRST